MSKLRIKPPLPFVGNKKAYLKLFRQKLESTGIDWNEWTIVDLFGGSGILSHNFKHRYPRARVIRNDFDDYRTRLENATYTEEIRENIKLLTPFSRTKHIPTEAGEKILAYLKEWEAQHGSEKLDFLTVS